MLFMFMLDMAMLCMYDIFIGGMGGMPEEDGMQGESSKGLDTTMVSP
jgi:hypothetical protein